jgi:hypothetical protein
MPCRSILLQDAGGKCLDGKYSCGGALAPNTTKMSLVFKLMTFLFLRAVL